MKKKRFRRRQPRYALAILTLFILLSFSLLLFNGTRVSASPEPVEAYYTSIIVQQGDTLWSIAKEYAPAYSDIRDYLRQLRKMNNIKGEKLQTGQSLLIVYYK